MILNPLPAEVQICQSPAAIEYDKMVDGVLPPEEMLKGWARDRTRLVRCKRSNDSLVIYVEELRRGFDPGEVLSVNHYPL